MDDMLVKWSHVESAFEYFGIKTTRIDRVLNGVKSVGYFLEGKDHETDQFLDRVIWMDAPKNSNSIQNEPMLFDPATGEGNPGPDKADMYRTYHGRVAWLYNPWTGKPRDPHNIGSDVQGFLIA